MINTNDMNTRCLRTLLFFKVLILASSDMGTNQHLKIISGVANASTAKFLDSLCQRQSLWSLTIFNLITDIINEFIMEIVQRSLRGRIQVVKRAEMEGNKRFIIN